MSKTAKQIAIAKALRASGEALARLQGMKIRATIEPPRPAVGGFPYPARTCAEWKELPGGKIVEHEMTAAQRRRDAISGSARLRDAILKVAA